MLPFLNRAVELVPEVKEHLSDRTLCILGLKYDPNQPRDEIGRWTETGDTIQSFEKEIRGQDKEKAGIYKNGKFIIKKNGNEDTVSFTNNELGGVYGGILIHNHPNNTNLSGDDIIFMAKNDLSEIRAITDTGTFTIKNNPNWKIDPKDENQDFNAPWYENTMEHQVFKNWDKIINDDSYYKKEGTKFIFDLDRAVKTTVDKFGFEFKFEAKNE